MRGARDGDGADDPTLGTTCHTMIINADGALLDEAVRTHAVHSGMVITDLLKLVGAISLAAEQEPGSASQACRLIALAFDGVRARVLHPDPTESRPGRPAR